MTELIIPPGAPVAVGDELADQVGMHRDHLAPGSFQLPRHDPAPRVVRAVGDEYTAAPGNWAARGRCIHRWKHHVMEKEGRAGW